MPFRAQATGSRVSPRLASGRWRALARALPGRLRGRVLPRRWTRLDGCGGARAARRPAQADDEPCHAHRRGRRDRRRERSQPLLARSSFAAPRHDRRAAPSATERGGAAGPRPGRKRRIARRLPARWARQGAPLVAAAGERRPRHSRRPRHRRRPRDRRCAPSAPASDAKRRPGGHRRRWAGGRRARGCPSRARCDHVRRRSIAPAHARKRVRL